MQTGKQTLKIYSRGVSQRTISSETQKQNKHTIVQEMAVSVILIMTLSQVNSNKNIEVKYTRMTEDTITHRSKVLIRNSRHIETTNNKKQGEIPKVVSHPQAMLQYLHIWCWDFVVYNFF